MGDISKGIYINEFFPYEYERDDEEFSAYEIEDNFIYKDDDK